MTVETAPGNVYRVCDIKELGGICSCNNIAKHESLNLDQKLHQP